MKLKLTALYLLSFVCLTFLIHEVHDWLHTFVARILGGSWGPRIFDGWDFAANAAPSSGERILATIAGPLINFLLIWIGYDRMDERNSPDQQSQGITLVFATLPFSLLLAALRGGGDVTTCIRLFLPHADKSNHHMLSTVGLAIILILTVPPLWRAFHILPPWRGQMMFFPVMLLLPGFMDHWVVGYSLNKLLGHAPASQHYSWVIGWGLLVFVGWLLTRKYQKGLLTEEELPI